MSVVIILVAACGGDDQADDPTPTPSETPMEAPTSRPGVTPGPGVSDTQIVLGMTNDLSGEGGTPYAAVTSAVQAYFASVSAESGGVCGREVIVIAADDRYTPEIALEETKRLVEEEGVLAIIGAQSTDVHLSVAPYLNDPNADGDSEDGVPDLFLSSGWSGWGDTDRFPWSVGFIPDYASDGAIIASYIKEHLAGLKVGLLYEDSNFGRDYLASLEGAFPGDELLVATVAYELQPFEGEGTPSPDEEESPPAIETLIQELIDAGAEVVVLATAPAVSAEVFNIDDVQDSIPQFILSYVNTPSTLAAEIGGGTQADNLLEGFESLAGSVVFQYMLNLIEDDDADVLSEHQRIMETYDGPSVTTLSVYGQALAETMVETLSRSCDQLNRDGVLKAAESLVGFQPTVLLPGIEVNLSPQDHRAIETLQPVRIEADGSLTEIGDPIGDES
ncbi:MAG: ABC transporter substrate-binding protein [Chloroflexi bacterium]|nr:ABC transporter substrate-binding protein [Chloroflexota bacterium]